MQVKERVAGIIEKTSVSSWLALSDAKSVKRVRSVCATGGRLGPGVLNLLDGKKLWLDTSLLLLQ